DVFHIEYFVADVPLQREIDWGNCCNQPFQLAQNEVLVRRPRDSVGAGEIHFKGIESARGKRQAYLKSNGWRNDSLVAQLPENLVGRDTIIEAGPKNPPQCPDAFSNLEHRRLVSVARNPRRRLGLLDDRHVRIRPAQRLSLVSDPSAARARLTVRQCEGYIGEELAPSAECRFSCIHRE